MKKWDNMKSLSNKANELLKLLYLSIQTFFSILSLHLGILTFSKLEVYISHFRHSDTFLSDFEFVYIIILVR